MIKRVAVPLVVVVLMFAAGCTSGPDPETRERHRYSLIGTVDYLNRWSRTNLSQSLGSAAGDIPAGTWDAAVEQTIAGAAKVHIDCESMEVTRESGNAVEINGKGCGGDLESVTGCVLLREPTGSAAIFQQRFMEDLGTSAQPEYVESADDAKAPSWYVGACDG
ncbi:hypothetical protein [Actinoplanes aureus]|uniref:Lipoprotein n=1 Tax=Actinoplanes aureus TaxID=2792083 RepID=A0A931FX06_9ACTN|nr:hypothetical protein [Actinoplanes aureus]MBG0562287.1 hypothetical protein [Actinoplanes aureus]